ncbi:hypothetical protein [Pseudobutyrivibrio sp.]|jgi:hypothetical protein|uniref:hypothetical protein n=1 Tax=Pseudobutyrivibrio sp. TaxID=2014367 RepID=UPI0025D34C21|nr:hypothetical protein [Pseudobutyrivibrio sp.]
MNCKNCGAPVDGHIACPKCGQLVDFTGGISNTPARTSYGINWGTADTPAATAGVELAKENKAEATSVSKQVFEPANNTKVEPVTGKPIVETKAKTEDKPVIETTVKTELEKPVAENSVKTAPVVTESRTDTSEDESEDISIFDTFSEAMKDIAEDVLEVGDDMKEDIADVVANISDAIASAYPEEDNDEENNSAAVTSSSIAAEDKEDEPYRYKENKYEFSGSAKSSGTYNSGTYNNSKKNNDVDSKPAGFSLFLFFAFIIMALVISGTRNNKEDEYERAKQELYDNIDLESLQNMYGLNLHSSSSPSTVEEEPVVYVYADLGKIYNTDGESIEINEDAVVKSDINHQRIAYYQDGELYLVDGYLEPQKVTSNVKDFQILSDGNDLAYISENGYLTYRKYDKDDYDVYMVVSKVDSFVFSALGNEAGFLYVSETEEGKVLCQCDKDGKNRSTIASGECKPLSVSHDLDCTFYLDENNHLHRYYDGRDEDIAYDVTINDNSEYIVANDRSAILVNNVAVDGKIYCANKYTKELFVIDKPGLSEVEIYETQNSGEELYATYQSDEGLVEVKFVTSGSIENVITESTNVDYFAVNAKEDVVLYKLDNQLYKWSRTETTDEVIDEDASAIDNISVSSPGEFYYLKGSELYYYSTITHTHEPVLLSDEVDRIDKYTDNTGHVTIGFVKTDLITRYMLTKNGQYIQE